MKIGTVTYWWTQTNYGQVLQCFALIKYLQSLGHDASLIKVSPSCLLLDSKKTFAEKILKSLKVFFSPSYRKEWRNKKMFWQKISQDEQRDIQAHPRYFDDFRAKYIPSTSKVYTYGDLLQTPPEMDAYVCGSDQIWGGVNPVFFLQFGKNNVKKIAYAPSLGGVHPEPQRIRRIQSYLKSYSFISSREQNGVDILQNIGFKDACLVPDPTLLLSSDIYRSMESNHLNATEEPYVFVYLLGNPTDVSIDQIFAFAETHGLKVKYVAAQGKTDDFPKIYPTVEEWLELVDKAKYVITNSFHGTVFCLLMNTPFLNLPVVGAISRMNNRISDLLSGFDLSNRVYRNSLSELLRPMSFENFNILRDKKQNEVRDKLTSVL